MIRLLADSTCDLTDEIIEKYNIGIAPLNINIESKSYKDRIDITSDEFFSMLENLENHPTTSMPSPAEFIKLYKDSVQNGYKKILCICMSSGTSGSYQSAVIAKNQFLEENEKDIDIKVIDSKSMSHGSGYLILKTAMLLEKGASLEQLVLFNELYKKNIKHFLAVSDLDHLIRSGRLTNTSAFLGKLFRLKPIMTMKNAKGSIIAKERGIKRVLKYYVKEYKKRVDKDANDFIIIGYSSDKIIANNLKKLFLRETNFKGKVYIMQMGVAVGTHVGLGGISMFFIEKDHLKSSLLRSRLNKIKERKDKLKENLNF
ncbi:MAG: DegV family protein [Bacillota bacterium]